MLGQPVAHLDGLMVGDHGVGGAVQQEHRWILLVIPHLQVGAHVSRALTDLGIDAGLMGRTHHGRERAEIIQPEWIGLIVECVDCFKHVGGREAADHVLHRIALIGIGAVLIPRIVGGQPHQQRRVAAGRRAPDTEMVGVHVPLARVCPEIADGCFDVLEICGEHVAGIARGIAMIHRGHHKAFAGQSRELRDLVVAMRRGPGAALHEYHGGVAAVIVIAGGLW